MIGKITNAFDQEESSDTSNSREKSAEAILNKKLAEDEIDIEEFKRKIEAIEKYN